MVRLLPLTPIALALGACTTVPAKPVVAKPVIELSEQQARGYGFAKANCAACHGIVANASSPNPEAPPLEMVVNVTGLSARSLERFLRDSHNFPGQMAFEIDPAKVDDLTAYMMTLRRPGYNPDI
jgi:mono/diheme cytochrome c family protein